MKTSNPDPIRCFCGRKAQVRVDPEAEMGLDFDWKRGEMIGRRALFFVVCSRRNCWAGPLSRTVGGAVGAWNKRPVGGSVTKKPGRN